GGRPAGFPEPSLNSTGRISMRGRLCSETRVGRSSRGGNGLRGGAPEPTAGRASRSPRNGRFTEAPLSKLRGASRSGPRPENGRFGNGGFAPGLTPKPLDLSPGPRLPRLSNLGFVPSGFAPGPRFSRLANPGLSPAFSP